MLNKDIKLPHDIYRKYLRIINNVKFTQREIDIIACLQSGKAVKKIATLLSIAPKTVETHIHNIMLKLECNARESILDFMEKAGQFSALKEYYLSLIIQVAFEEQLQKILIVQEVLKLHCLIIYTKKDDRLQSIISSLKNHLALVGVHASLKFIDDVRQNELGTSPHLIYVSSCVPSEQNDQKDILDSKIAQYALQYPTAVTVLLDEATNESCMLQDQSHTPRFNKIDLRNYYVSVFDIIKILLPQLDVEKNKSVFLERLQRIYLPSKTIYSEELPALANASKNPVPQYFRIFKNLMFTRKSFGCLLIFLILSLPIVILHQNKAGQASHQNSVRPPQLARSDLPLPTDKTLIQRTHLIRAIGEKLNEQRGIQTVAIVGIGGSGKSTLARTYARQQQNNIVWEINAETKESLLNSFESLSYALTKTEGEKKILKNLQEIKNSQEREDKIIALLKEKLRSMPDWLLIYDNIENLASLQKYMPSDPAVWGTGKVILTTRDSNIKNNALIGRSIQIGELNPPEKLSLFIKIMRNDAAEKLTSTQERLINEFLKEIPPFPLDIALAAYYLKATNISYTDYVQHLKKYNNEFETAQENVLKEASQYTKTRYNIIKISLKQLKEINPDFSHLLLFICLLDSKNIPREVLDYYKDAALVDNFILHLKRYSLLIQELCAESIPSFSLHRSTQSISLATLIKDLEVDSNKDILQPIADSFAKYMANAVDSDDFAKMKILIAHGETFLSHHTLLNDNIRNAIKGELGGIYFYLGNYEKSKPYLEENLKNLQQHEHQNYHALARTTGYLANVHRDLGNYDESMRLLMKSRLIYQQHFPKSYDKIAWVLAHLGIVNRESGHYEDAKNNLEESLLLYQKHFPSNFYRTPWALALLGIVHRELGDYEKGKNLLEQSLALYKKYYPHNAIRQAWVLAHLGRIYRVLGDTKKAMQLLEESLKIYKNYFFEYHFEVIRAQKFLGEVYSDLGNYDKAVDLFKDCLNTYEKKYDKNHMEVARILTSLGNTYLQQDKLEDSKNVLERALTLLQEKNHADSYVTLEHLADLYLKSATDVSSKGNQLESLKLKNQAGLYLKQALAIIKGNFTPNSPHIIRIQAKLEKLI